MQKMTRVIIESPYAGDVEALDALRRARDRANC
jgi:hypothetical protein